MFKKNATSTFIGLDKLRKDLDAILADFKDEDPEKILKFPYDDLSDYFKSIKIESVRKRKEESKFPAKPGDYVIKSGGMPNYSSNEMKDSFPLFYMEGIYRTRYGDYGKEYFGIKLNGKVIPAAYMKRISSDNYKVYLNYDVIKSMDNETLRKLIAATSIRLADYKSVSYFS
jgi:hypothetical protein